jgi:hypothetical protein
MGYGPKLTFLPVRKHTYQSVVTISQLPKEVPGIVKNGEMNGVTAIPVKDAAGFLIPEAIPMVTIFKVPDGVLMMTPVKILPQKLTFWPAWMII